MFDAGPLIGGGPARDGSARIERRVDGADAVAVIVSYKSEAAIEALLRDLPADLAVVIADNDPEASARGLAASRPRTGYVHLPANPGYGAAVNLAAAAAEGAGTIFVLNPDLQLAGDPFAAAQAMLDADPALGAVGERRKAVRRFGLPVCRWLVGAFMAIRAEAFRDAGGFDEDFFLYFEDVELSLRLVEEGWALAALPAGLVAHAAGASVPPSADSEAERRWIWGASCAVFIEKRRGHAAAAWASDKLRGIRLRALRDRVLGRDEPRTEHAGADCARRGGPAAVMPNLFSGGVRRSPAPDRRMGTD